ncbi:unnamed protein product, partial [Mesorhabditis spiculigera]
MYGNSKYRYNHAQEGKKIATRDQMKYVNPAGKVTKPAKPLKPIQVQTAKPVKVKKTLQQKIAEMSASLAEMQTTEKVQSELLAKCVKSEAAAEALLKKAVKPEDKLKATNMCKMLKTRIIAVEKKLTNNRCDMAMVTDRLEEYQRQEACGSSASSESGESVDKYAHLPDVDEWLAKCTTLKGLSD